MSIIMIKYKYAEEANIAPRGIWGCNGFDRDREVGIASGAKYHLKLFKF